MKKIIARIILITFALLLIGAFIGSCILQPEFGYFVLGMTGIIGLVSILIWALENYK